MSARVIEPRGAMMVSALVALILSVLPLPEWLSLVRPAFLVLTVLYWSITAPRTGGLALGFGAGLALDVFGGAALLGQHALALTAITYIAVREHQKIRSKPPFQQALIVFGALVVYEFILFAIDGESGHPVTSPLRWIHTVTGAILWPLATAVLERSHSRR
jgi:rod shape-determining protein MreD